MCTGEIFQKLFLLKNNSSKEISYHAQLLSKTFLLCTIIEWEELRIQGWILPIEFAESILQRFSWAEEGIICIFCCYIMSCDLEVLDL